MGAGGRVLFTHQYSMQEVRALVAAGEQPAQHLWGTDALERAGARVEYGPFGTRRRVYASVNWRTGNRLGDIGQELYMWRRATARAVLLAGEGQPIRGLALLPARTRTRPRLVGVVHGHPAAWMARLDVAVCMSR